MKIRTRIALRITAVITTVMLIFVGLNYFVSSQIRKTEFYVDLKKEAVARVNFYFKTKVSYDQIERVKLALYDQHFNLLYLDANQGDTIPYQKQLVESVWESKEDQTIEDQQDYQTIGFIFPYQGEDYIVLASSFDSYGHAKMERLVIYLLILSLASLVIACILGYYLSKSALKPVAQISKGMRDITAKNLNLRLSGYNQKDEFGELASSFNEVLDIIETSFESQKMFVSNVSHELRTPLATLIGEIDLALLKERTAQEYKQTLINSRQDTNKLIKLLNGLLDLAKASYDKNNMSMTIMRIDEVLLDAVEFVLKGNPQYDVNIVFSPDLIGEQDFTITGNEYLLRTAFANLMENNCKYSENKTSKVRVSFFNKKVKLQFSDTGIGIKPEELKHLFTPFYRGSNKNFVDGNGIGLALVKKVVNLHQGSIDVYSIINQGTTFTIEFDIN